MSRNEGPKFIAPAKSVITEEGKTATFQAVISGKPTPDIKWYKDGTELKNSREFDISFKTGRAILKIPKAGANHVGNYKCEISNDHGKAECTCQLKIKGVDFPEESEAAAEKAMSETGAPQFTKKLESIITSEGSHVCFEVAVSGDPTPTVQWSHNGDVLAHAVDIQIPPPDGDIHRLIIPEVFDDDAGTYEVKAENPTGSSTCTATLVVNPAGAEQKPSEEKVEKVEEDKTQSAPPAPKQTPPTFTKSLSNITTKEGSAVQLECVVTGEPQPEVKWYREDIEIIPSPDFELTYENGRCCLNVPEVFADDSGTFKLTATNAAGSQSTSCQLTVEAVAPPPEQQNDEVPAPQQAEQQESTPTPPQPEPKPEPPPQKQPEPKPEPPPQKQPEPKPAPPPQKQPEPKPAPPPQQPPPQKTPEAKPPQQKQTQPPPQPKAQPPPAQPPQKKPPTKIEPPEFVRCIEPAKFVEGMSARFNCQVSGEPKPEVVWLLNGNPIDSGYRYICKYDPVSGRASLDITMLLDTDLGTYTCVAKSKAGQISCQAPLLLENDYKKFAKERAEQAEIDAAKSKRSDINRQLSDAFDKEGGKLTPSQKGHGGEPVYHDVDAGPIMTPFEKRLLREAQAREAQVDNTRPPIHKAEEPKVPQFEDRLQREIDSRGGDTTNVGREPFDVAKFEAELLNAPIEGTQAHPDTETELESEMETDTEGVNRPKFSKELKNLRIAEGASVQLACRVEGRPKPQLRWFKDGKPLMRSTRHDLKYFEGFCSLKISLVLPEDKGAYTVLAESPSGRAITTGLLYVDLAGSKAEIPQHMKGAMGARVHMEGEAYSIPQREKYAGDVAEKHYKPKFKEIPTDMSVREGKMARFDLRVTGRPPPDLIWYRNEQQLYNDSNHRMLVNEGGNQSLIIPYVLPSDGGTYTCRATNRAGTTEFSVQLNVQAKADMVAPSFIDRIENLAVNEGEEVIFTSKVNGSPLPQVTWQKDGQHIKPGHPTMFFEMDNDNCKLTIPRAGRRDAGWYTCVAFNKAGRVACRAKLQVITDRSKKFQPTPQAETYRLPQRSNETMTRIELEREEVPSYVRPQTYSDDEDYPRPAVEPPEFLIPLNDMLNKVEGQDAHFACRLKNAKDSSLRVDWYLNDTPLFIGSRVETSAEFGICTLDIRGLKPEDSGIIKCRARNASGVAETSGRLACQGKASLVLETQLPPEMRGIEKTLQFEEDLLRGNFELERKDTFPEEEAAAPEFLKVPEPVCVFEGEPARFSCRITGHPLPRILWYKNGEIMVNTSRVKISFDGIHQMDIPRTRFYDSGTVRIVATNKHGSCEFESSLEVMKRGDDGPVLKPTKTEIKDPFLLKKAPVGPELKQAFTDMRTHPTKPLRTDSPLKPYQQAPQPQQQHRPQPPHQQQQPRQQQQQSWQQPQQQAAPQRPPPQQVPQPVKPVTNEPTFIFSPPPETIVDIGDPIKLTASLTGNPAPKVTWFKDNFMINADNRIKMLQENTNYTLLFVEALPEDAGSYEIEAVNPSGTAKQRFKINVKAGTSLPKHASPASDMPKIPAHPVFEYGLTDIDVPEGCPVELACQVTAVPKPDIVWYYNGVIIKPSRYFQMAFEGGIASLLINEVFPEDAGTYTCEAVNEHGSAVTHSHLKVQGVVQESEDL